MPSKSPKRKQEDDAEPGIVSVIGDDDPSPKRQRLFGLHSYVNSAPHEHLIHLDPPKSGDNVSDAWIV